jgi:hypothetical protein
LVSFALEEFEFPSSVCLEEMPLFPQWHLPLKLMAILMALTFLYTFTRDVLQPFVSQSRSDFYKIPILVMNKTLPWTAISLLALVYLPGLLAALLQLHRGRLHTHTHTVCMEAGTNTHTLAGLGTHTNMQASTCIYT